MKLEAGASSPNRRRILDLETRIARQRRRALSVIAVCLILAGPWIGWWCLAPLLGAAVALGLSNALMKRSAHPDRWVAAGWAIAPLMIAVSVALTGAAQSPAVAWFALPAVTLVARFDRRGVLLGCAYIVALMVASTAALQPEAVVQSPPLLTFPLALLVASVILATALADSDREHRQTASTDSLTGLPNRAALGECIFDLERLSWKRADEPLSLLIGDIDHFKRINDGQGHLVGDLVLQDVASILCEHVRERDQVYRIGGEEFLVLLPACGTDDAGAVADKLRVAIREALPHGLEVSMSFGVTSGRCRGVSFAALFAEADAALYQAKRTGRDRVVSAGSPELEAAPGDLLAPAEPNRSAIPVLQAS